MHHNGKAAVRVWNGGDPLVRRNRIREGRTVGILVYEFGRGHFVENEIFGHASWNIEVRRQANRVEVSDNNASLIRFGPSVLCR